MPQPPGRPPARRPAEAAITFTESRASSVRAVRVQVRELATLKRLSTEFGSGPGPGKRPAGKLAGPKPYSSVTSGRPCRAKIFLWMALGPGAPAAAERYTSAHGARLRRAVWLRRPPAPPGGPGKSKLGWKSPALRASGPAVAHDSDSDSDNCPSLAAHHGPRRRAD